VKFVAAPSVVKSSSGGSCFNNHRTFSGKNTAAPKPAVSTTTLVGSTSKSSSIQCLKCGGRGVIPNFKDKTRYTPYVSFKSKISHIATNKG
jgi:hypothetical protein